MMTKKGTQISKDKILQTLTDIGLNNQEAATYLSMLSLGPTSVIVISRSTGLKRTTAYHVLDSLTQRGLVVLEMNGLKKNFVALHPEKLHTILKSQVLKFETQLEELVSLYNNKTTNLGIRTHFGIEAVKHIYEDILNEVQTGSEYLVISDDQQWFDLDRKFFEHFTEKRARLKLNTRLLLRDSLTARNHKKFERNFNEKIKIFSADLPFNTNIIITPGKLVLHQLTEPVHAIIIDTKTIIDAHRTMFEMLWNSSN
jgi:sugar-specific transcriptional regulator TrmB